MENGYISTNLKEKPPPPPFRIDQKTDKTLLLETISACNLRCSMCAHTKLFSGQLLPAEKINEVFLDVKRYNETSHGNCFTTLRTDGNSEPLIYKNLVSMIKTNKKLNPSMKIDVITNGVLLTAEIRKGLLECDIDFLRISATGITAEVYKYFQGSNLSESKCGDNLKSVIQNTIEFIALKNLMGKKTIVEIRYIISDNSKDSFISWLNFWKDNGVNQAFVSGLGLDYIKKNNQNPPKIISYKKCSRFGQIIIKSNGTVLFSCCEYAIEPLGNIFKTSFYDIITSQKYLALEEAHSNLYINKLPKICANCPSMHIYQ